MNRFFRALPALALLLPTVALAQLAGFPLSHDPSRTVPAAPTAAANQRPAVLALPFFDDFTAPLEGPPKPSNWTAKGGALVNNRLAVKPLTRGSVSLDGLLSNGLSYSPLATDYGPTDTLTSLPIDLSGRSAASQLYLSYAWQAGSIIGGGHANNGAVRVSLELQFLTSAGQWVAQWRQLSTGRRTPFRQRTQAVADPRYLHSAFQFRFLATGDRTSSSDVWGLDYIKLDANRSPADTTYVDLAIGAGLSSPLRRFTAMPAYQFNAVADTAELSRNLFTDIVNLNSSASAPAPINWLGTVRETGGAFSGTWLRFGRSLPNGQFRRDTIRGDARRAPVPPRPGPRRLRYTLALNTQEVNRLTQPNDTTTRTAELSDYYAYDDGTPELAFGLSANPIGQQLLAVRFDLNRPDQVWAIRIAPIFFGTGNRSFTAKVWADNNGQPGQELASVTTTLRNPLPAGQVFVEVPFRTSVPVTGTFYVGYAQAAAGNFLQYGVDLNNTRPGDNYLFQNLGQAWEAVAINPNTQNRTNYPGALLLRPVMTDNQTVVTAARAGSAASAQFTLYPNPAHGLVAIEGPAFATARVFDALGRLRQVQPAAPSGPRTLPLDGLAPGVYLVQLTLPDGAVATRRLVVE